MDNRMSFGIGCFHFGLKKTAPFRFDGSEYRKEFGKALESIQSIDNISIDILDEEFERLKMDVTEELPNIGEGPGFFPRLLFTHVGFEVYIPFRIQAQLWKRKLIPPRTFTERFRLAIHYMYHMPVAFVEPINPSQEPDPSDAVIVMREFLKQELGTSKSDYIRFESLGPSPFHADCYIQEAKTQASRQVDWAFQAQHLPSRGYGRIVFEYNPAIFGDAGEARDAILEEIADELNFFYYIQQGEVGKIHDWNDIAQRIDQLIAIQRMGGIKAFLQGLFVRPRLIQEAVTALVEFEAKELEVRQDIQRDYKDLWFGREELYFQSYIDRRVEERMSYPTEEARQLISFFEGRRVKSVEILVVLGSAMLGGGIGALLTKLLSK